MMARFVLAVVAAVCLSGFVAAAPAAGDDVECVICEYLVKEIDSELQANKTQSEIIAHLDAVCKKFGHLAGICDTTVNHYAPALISALANDEPPATACKKVDACKSNFTAVASGPICAVCEVVVGEIDKDLQANKTEYEIILRLDDVCKATRVFKAECDKVVAEYVPDIISRLAAKEDPQFVCAHVHLCDNATFADNALLAFETGLRADNETCEICEFALEYAEKYIKQHPNMTSAEVSAEMEKVCHFLPKNDSDKCDNVVKLVEPLVYSELKLGVAPAKICHDAKLCASSATVTEAVKAVAVEAKAVVEEAKKVVKDGAAFIKKLFRKHRN